MTTQIQPTQLQRLAIASPRFQIDFATRKFIQASFVIGCVALLCSVFCAPYIYLVTTSLKSSQQLSDPTGPLWPSDAVTFSYQRNDLPLYYSGFHVA